MEKEKRTNVRKVVSLMRPSDRPPFAVTLDGVGESVVGSLHKTTSRCEPKVSEERQKGINKTRL